MTQTDVIRRLPNPSPRRGFYSGALQVDDRITYECALDLPGVDDEISFLRMELIHIARHDPHNTNLNLRIVNTIDKLMRTRRLLQADKTAPTKKADRIAPVLAQLLGENPLPASPGAFASVDDGFPAASESGSPPADTQSSDDLPSGESAEAPPATTPSELFRDLLAVSPSGTLSSGRVPYFSHGVSHKTLKMRAKKKHARRR